MILKLANLGRIFGLGCFFLGLAAGQATAGNSAAISQPNPPHLGFGFNVNAWDFSRMQGMGFDWIKIFNPPSIRLPMNVLVRVDANHAHLANVAQFSADVAHLAATQGEYIEAYEIGNEPNLDASYGWAAPPTAADYVTLLCEAYQAIKAADSSSFVVSAGLAPTGRVTGMWQGHQGHNGLYQDERAFFAEFLAVGGADCADAIGYHPYGYSADFDAEPDIPSADPDQNCANGFCFRGVEKLYDMMLDAGIGYKQIWATEFGWIVQPPAHCLSDPSWQGRAWQIVTEQEQADNLAGAFGYAEEHYPWLGVMALFNLNFNHAGHLGECDQMRYYAVQDRPAEGALAAIPKRYGRFGRRIEPLAPQIAGIIGTAEQPITITLSLPLKNVGWEPSSYSLSGSGELMPAFSNPSNSTQPGEIVAHLVQIESSGRAAGVYHGVIRVVPESGAPFDVDINLLVLDQLYRTYLPLAAK